MAEKTTARYALTDVTWDNTLKGSYLNAHLRAQLNLYWPALSDLAHQLQDVHPHLDEHTCRILVDAAANGHLPVLLTLKGGHREIGTIGEIGAHPDASLTSRTWGFERRYRLDALAKAELPNAVLGGCGDCGH